MLWPLGGVKVYGWIDRECRYSGTRRGIGSKRGHLGLLGGVGPLGGCQGCSGGWQGVYVLRNQKGYRWLKGVLGLLGGVDRLLGHQGCIGGLTVSVGTWGQKGYSSIRRHWDHQGVSGMYWGLAGSVGTDRPEGV